MHFSSPEWDADTVDDVAARHSVSGLAGKPRDEAADRARNDPKTGKE